MTLALFLFSVSIALLISDKLFAAQRRRRDVIRAQENQRALAVVEAQMNNCKMTCLRGSERGLCACKTPRDCSYTIEERSEVRLHRYRLMMHLPPGSP